MKEILLPFDFSAHSRRALSLALHGYPFGPDVNLTVVHVLEGNRVPAREVEAALQVEVEHASSSSSSSSSPVGVSHVVVEAGRGKVVPEIASMLRSARYDGVIIGGQGNGSGAELILGTTARRVVRQTTVPAYVVKRAHLAHLPNRLLCAVEQESGARAVLQMGRELVRQFKVVMETLTVIQTDSMHYPSEVMGKEWRREASRACIETSRALRELERELLGEIVSSAQHADYGPVNASIVRHAERFDTLVLGGAAESRPMLLTIGSTVEAALERSRTDVLVAR